MFSFLFVEQEELPREEIPEECSSGGDYLCKYLEQARLIGKPYLEKLRDAYCHCQSNKSDSRKCKELHKSRFDL